MAFGRPEEGCLRSGVRSASAPIASMLKAPDAIAEGSIMPT